MNEMEYSGKYIHQLKEWPGFQWNEKALRELLASIRYKQGNLIGQMQNIGFELRSEAYFEIIAQDVLRTSEIEGEILNQEQVRSSVARHLGIKYAGIIVSDRHIDGIVEMTLNATQKAFEKLSEERMFGWHHLLFPTGRSGLLTIRSGQWRDDTKEPMQVISGSYGKEKIHYEAPAAERLPAEMEKFLGWFNARNLKDTNLKASLAHFWFVTIHPFDDGNGRIARAIADMQLTKSDASTQRFYSMSAQILKERNEYYNILEKTQKGNLDITEWHIWFLNCLGRALDESSNVLSKILKKTAFWSQVKNLSLNDRQRKMLNKMIDDFEGKLTTKKWALITKCSHDTALRDIQDLIKKEILVKEEPGSKNTSYILKG